MVNISTDTYTIIGNLIQELNFASVNRGCDT